MVSIVALSLLLLTGPIGALSAQAPPQSAPAPVPLDTAPLAVFGAETDEPLFQVVGAALIDGQVIVANGGTHRIHVYEPNGTLVRTAGGPGGGPGEFRRMVWTGVTAGRFFVFDFVLSRLTELSSEGEVIGSRQIRPAAPYRPGMVQGVFPDGSVLLQTLVTPVQVTSRMLLRDTFALLRLDPQAQHVDSVGAFVWSERYVESYGRDGGSTVEPPLGKRSGAAVSGWWYSVLENDDATIAVYDSGGTKLHEIRPAHLTASVPVTRADVAAARAMRIAAIPADAPRQLRDIWDRAPAPSTFPTYGWGGKRPLTLLRADETGNLWVLEFGGVRSERPIWTVLRPDGTLKARVTAERELNVLWSNDSLALVHRWDELDVETLELRRFDWGGSR